MKISLHTRLFFLLLFQLFLATAFATDEFSLGVGAYRKGDYPNALLHFKKCPDSPAKFYNLGNCYYKLDSLGLSILQYQKAKKILGEEPDLMNNLQMANAKTRDKMEPPKTFFLTLWLRQLILFFPVWFFPLLAVVLSALASLFFVLLIRSADFQRRRRFFLSVSASVLLLLLCIFMTWRRQAIMEHPSGVVVTAPVASVLNEPVFGATELFVLHEGTVLRFLDDESGWVKVELPQGTSGFIRLQEVGKF